MQIDDLETISRRANKSFYYNLTNNLKNFLNLNRDFKNFFSFD
jgi:hypothetical protein